MHPLIKIIHLLQNNVTLPDAGLVEACSELKVAMQLEATNGKEMALEHDIFALHCVSNTEF